jgi:hypothetical protein
MVPQDPLMAPLDLLTVYQDPLMAPQDLQGTMSIMVLQYLKGAMPSTYLSIIPFMDLQETNHLMATKDHQVQVPQDLQDLQVLILRDLQDPPGDGPLLQWITGICPKTTPINGMTTDFFSTMISRLQDTSTLDFSTPNFNPVPFLPQNFQP